VCVALFCPRLADAFRVRLEHAARRYAFAGMICYYGQ
jgi:hypothetical protein